MLEVVLRNLSAVFTLLGSLVGFAGCEEGLLSEIGAHDGMGPHVDMDVGDGEALAPDAPELSCDATGVPTVGWVLARRGSASAVIELEIAGDGCQGEVFSFGFRVLDKRGNNVTGRSWPEVQEIDQTEADAYTLYGEAWSCGNFDAGETIEVTVTGPEGVSVARSAVIDQYTGRQ